jgi:hypothetical protein
MSTSSHAQYCGAQYERMAALEMAENTATIKKQLDEIQKEGLAWFDELEKLGGNEVSWKSLANDHQSRAGILGRRIQTILGRVANIAVISPVRPVLSSILAQFDPALAAAPNAIELQRVRKAIPGVDYHGYPSGNYEPISLSDARQTVTHAFRMAGRLLNVVTGESSHLPVDELPPTVIGELKGGTHSPTPVVKKKRGPRPDIENHKKVADIVGQHPDDWRTNEDVLEAICRKLDSKHVPTSTKWKTRSWKRAQDLHRKKVVQAIEYRLKKAAEPTS